jgi:hypothetical protein
MNLVERAKHILLTPRPEWEVIDGETTTTAALYTGYIVPAGGDRADCSGHRVLPARRPVWRGDVPGAHRRRDHQRRRDVRAEPGRGLRAGAHHRRAGADVRRDQEPDPGAQGGGVLQHASWVAGVFSILPGLRALTILGLYSIYVLYLGLPVLMKAPAEKAGAYTAIVIVAAIVLFALVTMLAGTFAATAMG